MKYLNKIIILTLISIILSCSYSKNNNVEFIEIDYDKAIIIELNHKETSIIDSVINHFIIKYGAPKKVYMNNILYVDNLFIGTCNCFGSNNINHEYTYENMVKRVIYHLESISICDEIIESFINNNINIWQLNNSLFKSDVSFESELSDTHYLYFIFSNIGMNNSKNEALIHVSINNFRGIYIHLIKNDEIWSIINEIFSWLGP
jgi:hypothetical protein